MVDNINISLTKISDKQTYYVLQAMMNTLHKQSNIIKDLEKDLSDFKKKLDKIEDDLDNRITDGK